jgi:hypothetical protein
MHVAIIRHVDIGRGGPSDTANPPGGSSEQYDLSKMQSSHEGNQRPHLPQTTKMDLPEMRQNQNAEAKIERTAAADSANSAPGSSPPYIL